MILLFRLQFTSLSAAWLLLSLLIGAGYAYFLYYNGASRFLSGRNRNFLFLARTLSVALICFLLFAPLVKLTHRSVEKPVIIIAQDNSSSIRLLQPSAFDLSDYSARVLALQKELASQYDVEMFTFGDSVRTSARYSYEENNSDLRSLFLMVKQRYSGRNVGAIVLASDGIYTRGGNPHRDASALNVPVFTVALGDTTPQKDILINNLTYNSVVSAGSRVPLQVGVRAKGARGLSSRLTVKEGNRLLYSEQVHISADDYYSNVLLTLPPLKAGGHFLMVELASSEEELTVRNNSRKFFIEVLDRKKKIALLADSPHPDISALKRSIELHDDYELEIFIANEIAGASLANTDLVILHQLPSQNFPLNKLPASLDRIPQFFILGPETDIQAFSDAQNLLQVSEGKGAVEILASLNRNFSAFSIDSTDKLSLNELGPLLSPAAGYSQNSAAVILLQEGASGKDGQPVWLFSSGPGRKQAVLTGEGFWKWRLNEFRLKGGHQFTDELLSKTVLYLTTNADQRRLRVSAEKQTFEEGEQVALSAELYNDVYELTNDPDASIVLKRADGTRYPFLFSRTGNSYRLNAGTLPAGEYSYEASAKLGDTVFKDSGGVLISQWDAEYRQTEPDHQLLSRISQTSGGAMVLPHQLGTVYDLIRKNEKVTSLVFEDKRYEDLIQQRWLFVLILVFLGGEWLLRKRAGGL